MAQNTNTYIIQLSEIWAKKVAGTPDASAPTPQKIEHGFDYGEKPSHATFNWIMNKVMANAVAVQQNGILPWDSTVDYKLGAVASFKGSTAVPLIYQAIKGDANNKNLNKPVTDKTWWKQGIEETNNNVKKDGNNGADSTGGDITGTIIIKSGARLIIEA